MKKNFSFFITLIVIILTSKIALEADEEDIKKNPTEMSYKEQTINNLKDALSGECQANRKYLAFSEIADKEGFPGVARLWRAAAAAEAIHANNHMKALGMLKSTKENLQGAVTGEQYEFETMYPQFIKVAKESGNLEAAKSMEYAFKVEQLHHKMFKEDLKDLEERKQPELVVYWICRTCGNTVPKSPPEICPICGSPKSQFFEIK